jgi:dTDP-4-amino-4,6-dideoxygalactose transaminase
MISDYFRKISQGVSLLKARVNKYARSPIKITYDNFSAENALFIDEIADELEKVLKLRDACEFGVYQKEFEAQCSAYFGVPYALGTSSGTAALSFSLTALGVGKGDYVITTPHTYIATALSISDIGAIPVFIDIGDDFNIDPEKIDEKTLLSAKAIIPVHLYGLPCQIGKLSALAKSHGVYLIEDCCQAQGSSVGGKLVGTFGNAGCFSFHPSKIVGGLGDGGLVITSEQSVAKKIERLKEAAYNDKIALKSLRTPASLDVIHIPFLKVKLRHINEIIRKKKSIADIYAAMLSGIPGIILPQIENNCSSSLRNYTIRAAGRDRLLKYLISKGIEAKIFYDVPLHLREEFRHLGYKKGDFPVCEKMYAEIISLPISYSLTIQDAESIAGEIRKFYEIPSGKITKNKESNSLKDRLT